jgi:hypothetical protein
MKTWLLILFFLYSLLILCDTLAGDWKNALLDVAVAASTCLAYVVLESYMKKEARD